MYGLPADTWWRLLIWMVIGLVLYFVYGARHAHAMQKNALKPLQLAIIISFSCAGGLYWYAGNQQERYDAAATQYLRKH